MPSTSSRGAGAGARSMTASRSMAHPEVGERGADEHGGDDPGQEGLLVEVGADGVEQRELLVGLAPRRALLDRGPLGVDDLLGCLGRAPRAVRGEAHEVARAAVDHPAEVAGDADRPGHGRGLHADVRSISSSSSSGVAPGRSHLLMKVSTGRRRVRHTSNSFRVCGSMPLADVEDHDRRVGGRQHPVGVLGEVPVAGGVEQVHHVAAVGELQHGGADRDAPLLLELHPVRGRRAAALPCLHRAGPGAQRPAVEEELLGERGLARVGVADDGERAAAAPPPRPGSRVPRLDGPAAGAARQAAGVRHHGSRVGGAAGKRASHRSGPAPVAPPVPCPSGPPDARPLGVRGRIRRISRRNRPPNARGWRVGATGSGQAQEAQTPTRSRRWRSGWKPVASATRAKACCRLCSSWGDTVKSATAPHDEQIR